MTTNSITQIIIDEIVKENVRGVGEIFSKQHLKKFLASHSEIIDALNEASEAYNDSKEILVNCLQETLGRILIEIADGEHPDLNSDCSGCVGCDCKY